MPGEQDKSNLILPTSALNTQQEKPSHYTYLKDFRVEPCPLFKQHQCQQHRPYSCFYWHFANQRRRRPVRKKEGTFNYSADIYCTKYDENTGICPDNDDCPYLHRVYGDVERKYHLRYYKTALCVHSADAKGHCFKNGQHCAFAHGPDDLRNPIFDIRELQQSSELSGEFLDRDRLSFVVEDPIWQEQEYVLANYKTDLCKKPPRLCRQGYACPFYHNNKDKRRAPSTGKYRSTPCPNVKHGDEWGDPEICDAGENCVYCHTRTEQQFHPEIYKSTKCNDMQQHGYCPRGPFCAFAHTDGELHAERQLKEQSLLLSSSQPTTTATSTTSCCIKKQQSCLNNPPLVSILSNKKCPDSPSSPGAIGMERKRVSIDAISMPVSARRVSMDNSFSFAPPVRSNSELSNGGGQSVVSSSDSGMVSGSQVVPVPSYSAVLKQRHGSGSTSKSVPSTCGEIEKCRLSGDSNSFSYSKAPGFEREQQSPTRGWPQDNNNGGGGEINCLSKIKASLYLSHEIGCDVVPVQTPPTPGSLRSNSFSPFNATTTTASIWQQHVTKDSLDRNLIEDISLEDLAPITERDEHGDSLPSSLSHYTTSPGFYGSSAPVTIPGAENVFNAFSASPRSHGSAGPGLFPMSAGDHQFKMSGSFGQSFFTDINAMANGGIGGQALNNSIVLTELQRAKEELNAYRMKLASYEESSKQSRQSQEMWKRRAEELKQRELIAEQEKVHALQERDSAVNQFNTLRNELQRLQLNGVLPLNTDNMPLGQLEQVRNRLRAELDKVERQIQQRNSSGPMCARCGRTVNGTSVPGSCPVCSPNSKTTGTHAVVT